MGASSCRPIVQAETAAFARPAPKNPDLAQPATVLGRPGGGFRKGDWRATIEIDMKITSIPQVYRNVNRWGEILSTLSKYGLADWISRFDLSFAKGLLKNRNGEALARHTRL